MTRLLACCALLLLLPVSAVRARNGDASDYRSIIPRDWTASRGPGAGERRFTSPDDKAWLSLHASAADHGSARDHIEKLKHHFGRGVVTYERDGKTWIVVSGFKGSRIFYYKAMLACRGRAWHYLELEYPRSEKRPLDEFVTRASDALNAYSNVGCSHHR